MRVLIDECLPRRLAAGFGIHDVSTVPQARWARKSNGELLGLAEGRFDVFVTVDRGLPFEQNLKDRTLSIVAVRAVSNRYEDLRPLLPAILRAMDRMGRGQVIASERKRLVVDRRAG